MSGWDQLGDIEDLAEQLDPLPHFEIDCSDPSDPNVGPVTDVVDDAVDDDTYAADDDT